jgi:hypothetical protein
MGVDFVLFQELSAFYMPERLSGPDFYNSKCRPGVSIVLFPFFNPFEVAGFKIRCPSNSLWTRGVITGWFGVSKCGNRWDRTLTRGMDLTAFLST